MRGQPHTAQSDDRPAKLCRVVSALFPDVMSELKSCGFLIFRRQPEFSFLLMKHRDRWDLPKGHVDEGEDELACALRELAEETGIERQDLKLDSLFRFTLRYPVRSHRTAGRVQEKTLVAFLAELVRPREIKATEHVGYRWFRWQPPHQIQAQTIDPLLAHVEQHFARQTTPFNGHEPGRGAAGDATNES